MHVTGKRVSGGFQSQRRHILQQLIQGVNFFDLMNDVQVRGVWGLTLMLRDFQSSALFLRLPSLPALPPTLRQ